MRRPGATPTIADIWRGSGSLLVSVSAALVGRHLSYQQFERFLRPRILHRLLRSQFMLLGQFVMKRTDLQLKRDGS